MLGRREVARREFLPRPQDGEPRALLERVVAEASDPRLHGDATRGPVVATEAGAHQGGGMVEVVGREGVGDRQVEVPRVLVPSGRSIVQHRGSPRLTRLELVLQELPQQRVIAVRPAVLVDQDGRAREVGEQLARPGLARDRIADRPVEPLQDRRPGQEVDGARGALLEHLRPQVVGDRALVSGDVGDLGRTRPAMGHRCEDEQRRPSLRAPGQPRQHILRDRTAEVADELEGLLPVHGQLRGADLDERAIRPPAGDRQVDRCPTGDGDLRAGRQVVDELGERVEARSIGDPMRVVDDHQQRRPGGGRGHELADRRARRQGTRPDRREDVGIERRDAVERRGEVAEQHDRIVVTVVRGQPGDRLPLGAALREHARLAISRRCDDQDDALLAGGSKPAQQPRPAHRPRALLGHGQLGVEERWLQLPGPSWWALVSARGRHTAGVASRSAVSGAGAERSAGHGVGVRA